MREKAILLKGDGALDAFSLRLPRSVRLIGASIEPSGPRSLPGLYEFEVVSGNACYREGERFYLTPAQALRVYGGSIGLTG